MPKVNGTPKVRFNLLNRKEEKTYLYALLTYRNGQRVRYAAGEKIRPEFWDSKSQRLTLNRKYPEHNDINLHLNKLELTMVEIYRDFENGNITPDDFRNEIDYRMGYKTRPANDGKNHPTLFDFIETYILEKSTESKKLSIRLNVISNLLHQYAEERSKTLNYDDIDFAFFSDFKAWLYTAPRSHSINYSEKVISILRQFMRNAQKRGYHNKTDFEGFIIKKVKTTKFALSFDELEELYHLDLTDNKRLEKVRDLFLIGAYTGLRFSDFTRIKPQMIEEIDGEQILTINTQKTGHIVSMPLLPISFEILKKYGFTAPGNISNQKMNEYLKELGQLAGMNDKMIIAGSKGGKRKDTNAEKWEKLTSHVARRSFATNFYRDGHPVAVLMRITGHSTEKQFMQYIAIEGKLNALHFAEMQKGKIRLMKVAG